MRRMHPAQLEEAQRKHVRAGGRIAQEVAAPLERGQHAEKLVWASTGRPRQFRLGHAAARRQGLEHVERLVERGHGVARRAAILGLRA